MPHLRVKTVQRLQQKINSHTQGPKCIPKLVYAVVDRDGQHIFKHAAGQRAIGLPEPMTFETTFWIASCTKLITAIAAMQLVEQERVGLDTEEDIQRILPELSDVKVLVEGHDGRLKLVDQERSITLRMLLAHTGEYTSYVNIRIPFDR